MELPNDVNAFLSKFGAWILSAVVATVAKVSHEILMKRKLTWLQWMAIGGISLFWAWMAGLFCAARDFNTFNSSFIVGGSALLGEKISVYVAQNYKMIFERLINVFSKTK